MRAPLGITLATAFLTALALSACDVGDTPTTIDDATTRLPARFQQHTAGSGAAHVEHCRDGGWRDLGFRNQGECVAAARHDDGRGRDDTVHGGDPAPPIVFDSDRDGDYELFAIEPDGTGLTQLTSAAGDDRYASWFPGSASELTFVSERAGGIDIFTLDITTGTAVQVTDEPGINFFPDVSPDGSQIAFSSTRDGGDYELYVVGTDGGGLARLTVAAGSDRDPDWSPDGTQIAFSSERDGNDEIYVMNADGSGVTRITNRAAQDIRPAWSPGGDTLAFVSNRDANPEVFLLPMVGGVGTPVQLTSTSGLINSDPTWSPDGRDIAFTRRAPDTTPSDVWIISVDGTGERRVTSDPAPDRHPDWRRP